MSKTLTDVAGRPGSIEREALMAQMEPAERCVNRILDQAIRAVRFEAPEEETYRESLRILEAYVRDEVLRRTVHQAKLDTEPGHLEEAAHLLRTMRTGDDETLERLAAWYRKDAGLAPTNDTASEAP